jgi:hypothetical protein
VSGFYIWKVKENEVMIVITYVNSHYRNTACNCHPEFDSGGSNLFIQTCENEKEVIQYIANKIIEYEEHDISHVIITSLDFSKYDYNYYKNYQVNGDSIEVIGDDDNYESSFLKNIQVGVKEIVERAKAAREEQRVKAKQEYDLKAAEQQRAAELRELNRLKAKLGVE